MPITELQFDDALCPICHSSSGSAVMCQDPGCPKTGKEHFHCGDCGRGILIID